MATTTNDTASRKSDIGIDAINLLKSPLATLIVLCSALLAQLPHAADVFRLIVVGNGLWPTLHSYTYAVALELAVLLFVVQRRNVESYLFAFVSILVNLSYYYLHGVALLSIAALPAWLVSIALPAAIAQYSHLIAAATDEHASPTKPVNPRRYFWQFWRPRAATSTETPTNAVSMSNTTSAAVPSILANPVATAKAVGASPDDAEQTSATSETPQGDRLTKEQRRALIAEWQLQKAEQVMESFGVGKRTADGDLAWVRSNVMHTNGVAK